MLVRQMLRSSDMKMEPVLAVDDDKINKNSYYRRCKGTGYIKDIPELARKFGIKNYNSNTYSKCKET